MTLNEFKNRCQKEYDTKNPQKFTISLVISIIFCSIFLLSSIFTTKYNDNFFWWVVVVAIKSFICCSIYMAIHERIVYPLPREVVKKAKKDKSYLNYTTDYPYSFLYPGEPYPFNREDVPPMTPPPAQNVAPAPAPTVAPAQNVAPAPAVAPVQDIAPAEEPVYAKVEPVAPQPEKIFCQKCGQQMLIPPNSGTVKVTCPKCAFEFVYTN